jgi:GR25 family glycosyltransferase involved in LPS biosynthesis
MAFVIHDFEEVSREEIVNDIIHKTKATVFQSCVLTNGAEGCMKSHIAVARLAKTMCSGHYLVFEDDCVLEDNWQDALKGMEFADVLYLGYNDKCDKATFGTHALYLSPKARDVIIAHTNEFAKQVEVPFAFDWILSGLCRKYGLIVVMPKVEDKERYCHQKRGLVSQITGKVRV